MDRLKREEAKGWKGEREEGGAQSRSDISDMASSPPPLPSSGEPRPAQDKEGEGGEANPVANNNINAKAKGGGMGHPGRLPQRENAAKRPADTGGDLPSITCFPPLLLKLGENPFGLLLLLFFLPRRPIAATGEEEAAALFFSLFKVCTGSLCPFCLLFLPFAKKGLSLSSPHLDVPLSLFLLSVRQCSAILSGVAAEWVGWDGGGGGGGTQQFSAWLLPGKKEEEEEEGILGTTHGWREQRRLYGASMFYGVLKNAFPVQRQKGARTLQKLGGQQ